MENTFTLNSGSIYTMKANGYCYVTMNGKKTRCSGAAYKMAEAQHDKEVADKMHENLDKLAKAKAPKKPRKSKDVAYSYCVNGETKLTLTAKQVDFIKHIPDTNFYEHGLDSQPWCNVLADEIGGQFEGKPMTVGAMISTLREKDLIFVGQSRINGWKCKYFGFTDLGKEIARNLGLK